MISTYFEARVCANPDCGLRFTLDTRQVHTRRCPICRSDTRLWGEPFGPQEIPEAVAAPSGPEVAVMIDNVRSAWNVGSILRAADGAGVRRVHICGISPLPDHPKVWKTSLGAERTLDWTYHPDGEAACAALKEAGFCLWALEGGSRSEMLYGVRAPADRPVVLVVGNEVAGVDPGILAQCERVVHLPMLGSKGSLNVAVAFGAAIYALRFGLKDAGT